MTRFDTFASILADLGTPIAPRATLLDFGCGSGGLVKDASARGIDAYGCDVDFDAGSNDPALVAEMRGTNRVRLIETPYRLPFDDATFDVVVSDQVFEHVRDYPQAIAELHRVMKPGAAFLHFFPSRYIVIEPHSFVPFGARFTHRFWLATWAALGVRNRYQRGLSVRETVERNAAFARTFVNYLPHAEIRKHFSRGFRIRGVEREFMARSPRARLFLLPALYRLFWSHCIHGVKV